MEKRHAGDVEVLETRRRVRKSGAMNALSAIPDPRLFPDPERAGPDARALYAKAAAALAAETALEAAKLDREIQGALAAEISAGGNVLATTIAGAPSIDVARHLWRLLDAAARDWQQGDGLAATIFAIPVIIVAAGKPAADRAALQGVLADPERLAHVLRDGGALAGNRNFALASALVAADAIDVARLPELLSWQELPAGSAPDLQPAARVRALQPAPLAIAPDVESVNLRFIVGTALARAGVDLLADATVGKWGMPFTQALGREFGGDGATVLALPRAPQRPLPALWQGRLAQREVSASLFIGNAVRKHRASVGEPTAVISAHRVPGIPGEGELRLSLSSPLEPRDAEGFRCPLYPLDRVGDAVRMLLDLLKDCQVGDVRLLGGVHGDREPKSGVRLLFKPETIPPGAEMLLH